MGCRLYPAHTLTPEPSCWPLLTCITCCFWCSIILLLLNKLYYIYENHCMRAHRYEYQFFALCMCTHIQVCIISLHCIYAHIYQCQFLALHMCNIQVHVSSLNCVCAHRYKCVVVPCTAHVHTDTSVQPFLALQMCSQTRVCQFLFLLLWLHSWHAAA